MRALTILVALCLTCHFNVQAECYLDMGLSLTDTDCGVADSAAGTIDNSGEAQYTCVWAEAVQTQNLASFDTWIWEEETCATIEAEEEAWWAFVGERVDWGSPLLAKIYIWHPTDCDGEYVWAGFQETCS